jgi:iron complex outermembrane receptor protein
VLALTAAIATLLALPSRAAAQSAARSEGAAAAADEGVLPDGSPPDDARPSPEPAPLPPVAAPPAAPPSLPDQPSLPAADVAEMLSALEYQDLSSLDLEAMLQYTVVTATKSALKEDEAPAITTVVTREEIQRWGYQSIAETLEHVAGIYMINDHIIPNISVRGISGGLRSESGLIKLMIDGNTVAFRSTAGNWLGPELVPLSAVQQIEVIRGPASSLYGADAFLGVINIVTRKADQMRGGEITLGGNREGGYGWNQDMALGASVGRWRILAALRTSSEDRSGLALPDSSPMPRLSSYAPADRRAHDLTLDSSVALARVSYQLGNLGTVALHGYLSSLARGAEFADWAQLTHQLDSNGRQNGTTIALRQGTAGLDLDLRISRSVDLRVNGLFFAGGPTAADRIDVNSDTYYVKRDFGYRGFDAGAEVSWHPRDTFSVLVGGGMLLDHEKLPTVYDVLKASLGTLPGERAGDEVPTSTIAGSRNLSNVGANALLMWSPLTRLTITGGGRYDHHSVYGGKLSGRLGGVVTLLPSLHAKLLYGSAFKAPSPQLLYGSPLAPGDIAGNEQLKPSYVHTIEGQLAYRPLRYFVVTSGVAYSYLIDQATFAQRGINQVALNISKVAALSWETEARVDYRHKLAAYANVSVNHTVPALTSANYVGILANYSNAAYPVLVGNLGVSAEIPHLPLRASLEASYLSARRSSTANALEAGHWYNLDPYLKLGGCIHTVGWQLLPHKETVLTLVLRNLTNSRYADPGFAGIDYPQLGRTLLLQATQEF